jgi:hypothetical protein
MAGQFFTKFGMDVMAPETTPNTSFLASNNWHYQRDGCSKSVRWDADEAIANDRLRMHITNLTEP